MLRLCGWSLAKMSGRAARRGHKSLKAQLLSLKSLNAEAEQELNKRRRLRFQRKKNVEQPSASPFYESSSSSGGTRHRGEAEAAEIALLPRNNDLETAIALSLYSERDARAELEFTRQLVNSTLLSLASPVGPWDPYDVKPQVFALDNYLALPVFTSIEYLRLFCDRFGFTVRDPSGVLWAAGQEDRYKEKAPLLLPEGVLDTMSPTATEERATEAPQGVTPEALFEDLSEDVAEAAPIETVPPQKKLKKKGRKRKGSLLKKKKKKKMADHPKTEIPLFTAEEEAQRERVRSHFREKIAATNPFHLTRATPIPVFGPFLRSFLVGTLPM
ncbi:hypothetical protein AGDE_14881 [Angomonas deanei]|uniref:Uncharacterized protein n=1 Tax=Angomonas deanei TaxID=59799 RepID=A0A7G2CG49_9TRYP|nr:hypothetical protein AGDE_14881 [Angomonas deanei]CAD2218489.1 hypothetical protein, conserved [Angomonas deanei]|eukprot:EPY20056.1 hypothetical protein AGDE_14881 [Angomonas deanei]